MLVNYHVKYGVDCFTEKWFSTSSKSVEQNRIMWYGLQLHRYRQPLFRKAINAALYTVIKSHTDALYSQFELIPTLDCNILTSVNMCIIDEIEIG